MRNVIGEQYSTSPGFRLPDFDTTCSVDPERQCPAKERLVSQFVGNAGSDGVDGLLSLRDKNLLTMQIGRYGLLAKADSYDEEVIGCPTQAAVEESFSVQTATHGIHGFLENIGLVRKRN